MVAVSDKPLTATEWLVSIKDLVTNPEDLLDISINELGWRAKPKQLRRRGIRTLGELIEYSESDLARIQNVGACAIRAIKEGLNEYGLKLSIKDKENT